jgi:hypothetical protein
MTIAAGFRCEEGIVICADREISRPTGKTMETKIWGANYDNLSVVVTGAGSWAYLRSAANEVICQEWAHKSKKLKLQEALR